MPDEVAPWTAFGTDERGTVPLPVAGAPAVSDSQPGDEHLLFLCAGVSCAAPLQALREVMLSTPRPVFLPFSPPWMLGVCPLRMELVGLVDPVPMLLGARGDGTPYWPVDGATQVVYVGLNAREAGDSVPALVVSGPDCALGWVVQAVGDIARIPSEDILTAPEQVADARLPFVARYVRGIYAPPDTDQRHVVLNVQRLLADLVDAMREKDISRG